MTTMLTEQEQAAVESILMDQLSITREQITPESRIQEDLGADSLDVIEIVMKLEERFAVTIADDVAEEVRSVQDVRDVLSRLLGR